MTRARTTRTPSRRRPSPTTSAVLSLVALAIVTGCGPAALGTDPPATAAPDATPLVTTAPSTTTAPSSGPPSPTDRPSAPPVETPAPSPTLSIASRCTGNAEQQDFFAAVAEAVTWDVYCPALPAGWFVDAGMYRLRDGGWLEIRYTGPANATLELREGAYCRDEGCVPPGTEAGEAAFADRPGTLVALDDGGFAIVVDRGAQIGWLAVGRGIGRERFVDIASALELVPA